MTRASEVLPAEQPPRRAVVYLYSQTGQLREVADALTAPLVARGWDIRWVDVQPRVAFPFPWPIRRFFRAVPRCGGSGGARGARHAGGRLRSGGAGEELAILAYQVWYLAPSLPIRSLLKAHPEAFRNRRVVSLIACRNMWYSAAIEVSGLLRSAGARSVEVVAATDTRPQWARPFVTTLRWLLTGRRESFLWFERAGVGPAELDRVAGVGQRIAEWGSVRRTRPPSCPPWRRRISLPGRFFAGGARRSGQAQRFGGAGAGRSLGNVRARLGNRHRGGFAAGRMCGTRRRRAVRRAGWVVSCGAGSRSAQQRGLRGGERRDGVAATT